MNLLNIMNVTNASLICLSKQGVIGREPLSVIGEGNLMLYVLTFS